MTFEEIQREAKLRGYEFYRTPDGKVGVRYPAKRDPEFERRYRANKAVIRVGLSSPERLRTKLDKEKDASLMDQVHRWTQRANDWATNMGQQAIIKGLEAMAVPSHLVEKALGAEPPVEAEREMAKSAAEFLVPSSLTGKAVSASMLVAPETLLGKLGVSAGAGAAAGALSGEGGLSGGIEGLSARLAGEAIPRAIGGIARIPAAYRKLKALAKAGKLTKEVYDDVVPGVKLADQLELDSFKKMINSRRNWVRALSDTATSEEAGAKLEAARNDIYKAVQPLANAKANEIEKAFEAKHGIALNSVKQGGNLPKEVYDEAVAVKKQADGMRAMAKRIQNSLKEARKLRKAAYGPGGKLKSGPTAIEALDRLSSLEDSIKTVLGRFDPKLASAFDEANEQYSRFAALRDMADNPKALTPDGKHVNMEYWQRQLDRPPEGAGIIRGYERRMGEFFKDFKNIIRRGADEAEGYDKEGMLGRVRGHYRSGHGYISANLVELLKVATGEEPLFARPVGSVPGLLPVPNVPPIEPPGPVKRVLGGDVIVAPVEQLRENQP